MPLRIIFILALVLAMSSPLMAEMQAELEPGVTPFEITPREVDSDSVPRDPAGLVRLNLGDGGVHVLFLDEAVEDLPPGRMPGGFTAMFLSKEAPLNGLVFTADTTHDGSGLDIVRYCASTV